MGRIRNNPKLQKQIHIYLDILHLPADDPRWEPIRRFVNGDDKDEWRKNQNQTNLLRKDRFIARLRAFWPLYVRLMDKGLTNREIADRLAISETQAYIDMKELGLKRPPVASYQVIDPKEHSIHYYQKQIDLARALHVKHYVVAGIQNKVIGGKEIRRGQFVYHSGGWHEVTA